MSLASFPGHSPRRVAWYSLFAHARNIPGIYGIRKIPNVYRTLRPCTNRVCSFHVVDRQRWLFFLVVLQVICSLSLYRTPFLRLERRESCSSRSNCRLYATCTMCFCGYQRVSANLFAMKSYPSCSTVS